MTTPVEPFERLRHEHAQILAALGRLEAAASGEAELGQKAGRAALAPALGAFLRFCEYALEPHLQLEEGEVHPLLERYLPPELGSARAMRREHQTLRGLLRLLRQDHERLREGQQDAVPEATTVLSDLALLLRDHIRKEDGLIHPLLERLLHEDVGARNRPIAPGSVRRTARVSVRRETRSPRVRGRRTPGR